MYVAYKNGLIRLILKNALFRNDTFFFLITQETKYIYIKNNNKIMIDNDRNDMFKNCFLILLLL